VAVLITAAIMAGEAAALAAKKLAYGNVIAGFLLLAICVLATSVSVTIAPQNQRGGLVMASP
jgi:hypothetical protein